MECNNKHILEGNNEGENLIKRLLSYVWMTKLILIVTKILHVTIDEYN